MTRAGHEIPLYDLRANRKVKGKLYQGVSESNLNDFEKSWTPMLLAAVEEAHTMKASDRAKLQIGDAHWDWTAKIRKTANSLAYNHFVIECPHGTMQAIMRIETEWHRSRLAPGMPLVYVDLISSAPWNRATIISAPHYKPCGSLLIAQAVGESLDLDYDGRVSLHSLPQSASWYKNKLGMTSFGIDANYENLEYFEFSSDDAKRFIEEGTSV